MNTNRTLPPLPELPPPPAEEPEATAPGPLPVRESKQPVSNRRRTIAVLAIALAATILLSLAGHGYRTVLLPALTGLATRSSAATPVGPSKAPGNGGPGVYAYDDLDFEAWFPHLPDRTIAPDIPGGTNDFHNFDAWSGDSYYGVTASYRSWHDYDAWVEDIVTHPADPCIRRQSDREVRLLHRRGRRHVRGPDS